MLEIILCANSQWFLSQNVIIVNLRMLINFLGVLTYPVGYWLCGEHTADRFNSEAIYGYYDWLYNVTGL